MNASLVLKGIASSTVQVHKFSQIFVVDYNSNIANLYGLLKVVRKSITTLSFFFLML